MLNSQNDKSKIQDLVLLAVLLQPLPVPNADGGLSHINDAILSELPQDPCLVSNTLSSIFIFIFDVLIPTYVKWYFYF